MPKRIPFPVLVAALAGLIVMLAIAVGWRLVRGDDSLLRRVTFSAELITPNADGHRDATRIAYEISRNAVVSIYFEDDSGQRYYFRENQPRGAGEYEVLFSGVVNPYDLPDEVYQGELLARLLQDGDYTWTIEAVDESGVVEQQQGNLTIADADTTLPELRDFSLDRKLFTPNRDGIDDRLLIQFAQQKEAEVRVFLLTPDGAELPIAEQERAVVSGAPGRHYYDYEGGVDHGAAPPEDGTYTIVALAQDAEGQKMRVTDTVTIAYGGVPRADIFAPATGDTFRLSATAVALCDTLYFTLTVQNYGETPIRTTGPPPGTVYDSDWNYNTVGWTTESGAWRVGVGYENELKDYPFRWALGEADQLEQIGDHLYLMPGQRVEVTGGIRLTGPLGERNPQPIWAGLIHEDVEIAQFNARVDPHAVLIEMPDAAHIEPCPEREIPRREREDE